jgi:hypothetical protein
MAACVSNKKMYDTLERAEDALIHAWIKFNYPKGGGPVSVYKCEDCGYYHFTSQGTMNAKLAEHRANGKIGLNKEADYWIDKLKNK